jgi:hypothetical protein
MIVEIKQDSSRPERRIRGLLTLKVDILYSFETSVTMVNP